MDSILTSIKNLLGIVEEDASFDKQIIMHINSVLMILTQMGVGPENGFLIVDDTSKWEDFTGTNENVESVKTYVYLKVKTYFDPPSSSMLEAINRQAAELEWRLYTQCEKGV